MNNCYFYRCDRCAVLINGRCSSKCKFKKSAEEYDEGLAYADEILEKKNLKRITTHDKNGDVIVTAIKRSGKK